MCAFQVLNPHQISLVSLLIKKIMLPDASPRSFSIHCCIIGNTDAIVGDYTSSMIHIPQNGQPLYVSIYCFCFCSLYVTLVLAGLEK